MKIDTTSFKPYNFICGSCGRGFYADWEECLECGAKGMAKPMQVTKGKLKAQKAHGFYDDVQAKDLNEQGKKIAMLEKELEFANNEATFWRLRAELENEAYTDLHFRFRIMTAPDKDRRAVQKEYMDYLDMVKEKRESQPILIVSDSKAVNKVNSDDIL